MLTIHDPQIVRFMPVKRPVYPLPWHNFEPTDPRPHFKTEEYARHILYALTGDDRRGPLRKVLSYWKASQNAVMYPTDNHRIMATWLLIEAVSQYSYILPLRYINEYLEARKQGA